MSSALQLGRKYSFEEQHGVSVCRIALQIFDQTQSIHGLDVESRTLLEVASLLHDIGHFVGVSDHHKHTFYLLQAGPIVGLSPLQMQLVANVKISSEVLGRVWVTNPSQLFPPNNARSSPRSCPSCASRMLPIVSMPDAFKASN